MFPTLCQLYVYEVQALSTSSPSTRTSAGLLLCMTKEAWRSDWPVWRGRGWRWSAAAGCWPALSSGCSEASPSPSQRWSHGLRSAPPPCPGSDTPALSSLRNTHTQIGQCMSSKRSSRGTRRDALVSFRRTVQTHTHRQDLFTQAWHTPATNHIMFLLFWSILGTELVTRRFQSQVPKTEVWPKEDGER